MKVYAAIYQLAIYAYFAAIRIVSLFNNKAKLFLAGRKGIFDTITAALANDNRRVVWMHCASLGEFEQGRPVLGALRAQYPHYAFVITFFSPSGYEVRKDYKGADHVFYLPMDSRHNAEKLLDIFKPALCIFVKYEFWYFYLACISKRKIPAILISAIFNGQQGFFKWYGGLQRQMLHSFSHIFVQDAASATLLQGIGINMVTVSGDTRFDRVIKAAGQAENITLADDFAAGHKILVAGSTWKEDEALLQKTFTQLPPSWKLILVPHEVNKEHIRDIEKLFEGNTIRWSDAVINGIGNDKRVLLVDKVGFLLQLYRYGTIAWVGGGFGKDGVHNVLEAAVYGIPCFYGPVIHQFIEAQELQAQGGAFVVNDAPDLIKKITVLSDATAYSQCAAAAKEYVFSKGGATEKVLSYLANTLS